MIYFVIDVTLGIGLIVAASYLLAAALKRHDPKFGRIDFLFAYLTYLVGITKILNVLDFQNVKYTVLGVEIVIVFRLIIVMRKLIPEAMKEPTRAKLVEEVKARTRKEIYDEIMNERNAEGY